MILFSRKIMLAVLFYFVCAPFVFAQPAKQEQGAYIAPRELMVLKSGIDRIYGSYVLAVINKSTASSEVAFKLNLPKELLDFQVNEGIEEKDVILSAEGMSVKKSFPPGVHVISISFATAATDGAAKLTLVPPRDLPEFLVMTPQGMMEVYSDKLQPQGFDQQDGSVYQIHSLKDPIAAGSEMIISLSGVPEGRKKLWITGAFFAVLLVATAGLLAWKTKVNEQEG